jgi:GTP-binding protein Era
VLTVYTKADLVPEAARPALAADAAQVSAATGEGIGALRDRLAAALPESPFLYDPDQLAAQPLRFFAAEFVREAAFAALAEELPYSVTCVIEEFRESAEPAYIRAVVYVERESQKGIVIGRDGHTIRDIGAAARERIETLMGARVYLDLRVKVMPGWRRRDPALKRLGYLS